jgi:hypothetical protein
MSPLNAAKREPVIDVGSAGFHPPSAMKLGVTHSESGCGFAPQDDVIAESARQLYTRKNRTISPPLWDGPSWEEAYKTWM